MAQKISIKSLMKAIKKDAGSYKKAVEPPVVRTHRERDMRQEAMDMGSHGANEMFGGKQ